jgi:hypothetical protein
MISNMKVITIYQFLLRAHGQLFIKNITFYNKATEGLCNLAILLPRAQMSANFFSFY